MQTLVLNITLILTLLSWVNAGTSDAVYGGSSVDLKNGKFRDCAERWGAGERLPGSYTIFPNLTQPAQVYCSHSLESTYTVIQRRFYGDVNFQRTWSEYQTGFGNIQGDHWLGLDTISILTTIRLASLQIDLQDWNGVKYTLLLHGFRVDPASNYYRMTFTSYSGSLPNDLAPNNGMYFYSPDRPDQASCAVHQKCGWWFNYQSQCAYFLPNGVYYHGGKYTPGQFYDGIYYRDWHGYGYSLKYITLSVF